MKLYRFAMLLAILLILLQASYVTAAGFGIGPATLHVQRAIKGWQQEETLFVRYVGDEARLVSLSASGDVNEWVSFQDFDDPSKPADSLLAAANEWTYVTACFAVPVDTLIGPAIGLIRGNTEPDEDAGESVGMHGEVKVVVQVTARKNIPAGTSIQYLSQEEFDFTIQDPNVGRGAVLLTVEVADAPDGAAIDLTVTKDIPQEFRDILATLAEKDKFKIIDIAYLITAEQVNLSPDNVTKATIRLKVNRSWADLQGPGNVRICKIGSEPEALETTFVGYEDDSAVFEAVCSGEFSHFALIGTRPAPESRMNWPLVGGIAGGILPLGVAGILLYRKKHGAAG